MEEQLMTIFLIFIFMAFVVCLGLLFTYGRDPMQGDEDYSSDSNKHLNDDSV